MMATVIFFTDRTISKSLQYRYSETDVSASKLVKSKLLLCFKSETQTLRRVGGKVNPQMHLVWFTYLTFRIYLVNI